MNKQFGTPILFLIYNRPELTSRVFAEIRKLQPRLLYVAADGPRDGNSNDKKRCKAARKIIDLVDWDCEIVTKFRSRNLGCRLSVSNAIDWFFENVESGIILEDDTLPNNDFFIFCNELLKKYENDTRIMQISGNNFQFGWQRDSYSYYFSNYGICWGWATWKRAWEKYDLNMQLYPEIKKKKYLLDIYFNKKDEAAYRELVTSRTFKKEIDTWDYQWWFAKLINNGLTIIPNKNLVSNIGFGSDAAHTFNKNDNRANAPLEEIDFPLTHPPFAIRDLVSDRRLFKKIFLPVLNSNNQSIYLKCNKIIKLIFKNLRASRSSR